VRLAVLDWVEAAGVGVMAAGLMAPGILYLAKSAHARELGGIQATLTVIQHDLAVVKRRLFREG
jgi:hypothetical protein